MACGLRFEAICVLVSWKGAGEAECSTAGRAKPLERPSLTKCICVVIADCVALRKQPSGPTDISLRGPWRYSSTRRETGEISSLEAEVPDAVHVRAEQLVMAGRATVALDVPSCELRRDSGAE